MSVKCSGSDLKAFFNDDSVWVDDNQKNYWINEIIIRINGVEQSQEFNIADIKDADDTEMLYGYISNGTPKSDKNIVTLLETWLSAREQVSVIVTLDKSNLEALKALLDQANFSVNIATE